MSRTLLLSALLGLLMAAPRVQAATIVGSNLVTGGMGGTAVFTKDADFTSLGGGQERASNAGSLLDVQSLYQLTKRVGLGINITLTGGRHREHRLQRADVRSASGFLGIHGVVRHVFLPEKRFSPTALGGLGWCNYMQTLEETPASGYAWSDTGTTEQRLTTLSSSGLGLMLGAGYEGMLTKHLVAAIEARWYHNRIRQATFGRERSNTIALLARLGWRFKKLE